MFCDRFWEWLYVPIQVLHRFLGRGKEPCELYVVGGSMGGGSLFFPTIFMFWVPFFSTEVRHLRGPHQGPKQRRRGASIRPGLAAC